MLRLAGHSGAANALIILPRLSIRLSIPLDGHWHQVYLRAAARQVVAIVEIFPEQLRGAVPPVTSCKIGQPSKQ